MVRKWKEMNNLEKTALINAGAGFACFALTELGIIEPNSQYYNVMKNLGYAFNGGALSLFFIRYVIGVGDIKNKQN